MLTTIRKHFFEYLFWGIGIGAIAVTIGLYINLGMENEIVHQLVVWVVASALMGIVTILYEFESLSHITITVIHFAAMTLIALTSGWILDYGDGSIVLLLSRMLPVIVVIYAAVHLLMFIIRKLTVQNLNDKLSHK